MIDKDEALNSLAEDPLEVLDRLELNIVGFHMTCPNKAVFDRSRKDISYLRSLFLEGEKND